ncbi:glycerophosphodiester phosphodiesterase family protein [Nonomuraea typhae]|uniref:glycerophosphodiester phosphodiesterase family protein n=1 Tax=Nonomuraea typhae TaxID=2603600 RepID=UPI001CA562C5|nr:glycerophosphodiester phosphodiesterase family protein [Nonomuraea typhae]
MSRRRVFLLALLLFAVLVFAGNRSWSTPDGPPLLLAHRGMAQTFGFAGITGDTCTAQRIHPPAHGYLENTIPSMRAAFAAGADVVEFDVQVTKDDEIAVFHDHLLECRTNGTGKVRDHTLAELRRLDVGFGYTADGGASFPFRGKGVGLMPTLEEVLAAFPGRELLLHIKSDDPADGGKIAARLTPAQRAKVTVYGGDASVAAYAAEAPGARVASAAIMRGCGMRYLAVGWTGAVPGACANIQLHVPESYAPFLWGWPHKFVERMRAHGTRVILVAGDGGWSEGFDSAADVKRLPGGFTGGVWTNRIEVVEPLLR